MSALGIDVGTSSCKGLVLTQGGKIIAEHALNYAQRVQVANDTAQIPAEIFRDGVFEVIATLAEKVDQVDPVRALAFSTHGETLIPVGEDEQAITPAILSMDRRCVQESVQLEAAIGAAEFYRITGTPMHSQYPMPKIMWLKKHHPEIADKVRRYCSTQDYLHGTLGAPGYVDYSLASRFGGLDVYRKQWSGKILECAGVGKNMLSEPVPAGTAIGTIPAELAKKLHLREGVQIVAGGHDQPCASLGMGAQEQAVTISAGSYECAALTTAKPLNDERGERYGLNSYCHVLKDQYVTLAFFASGLMVQWFLDRFCRYESERAKQEKRDIHEVMEEMMPDRPSGICMTPHVYGSMNPEWNENARTTISGLSALDDTASLYRAALEGTACELDLNIRVLEQLSGRISKITISGGGTRSERWMQMRSDITGRKIDCFMDNIDASNLGAAMLAGIGAGMFTDAQSAWNAVNITMKRYEPAAVNDYKEQKAAYLKLHRRDLFAAQ